MVAAGDTQELHRRGLRAPAPYVAFVFFWGAAVGVDAGQRSKGAGAL
jgi:hypothetical protein